MGALGIWYLLILSAIALFLFGGRGKISDPMGDFGKGVSKFKKSLAESKGDQIRAEAANSPKDKVRA